ncbi:Rz-like lysis system protein LysB [Pantoea pleuroti]|uniref:Rz-like lysis system protein LysB n=1 Tax=Pantoea pleuroti TaxID=1592631 RepID=UPI0015F9DF7F|nr:Rz-like lysis system protein LysB [Pantoea pleuroti]MBB1226005.1 LysB family phage lysis regulatory protein [Pantoea pleuroti]
MMRLIALLLAVALLALGVTGWQWKLAKDDLTSAQRIIGTLSAGIESRDKAIARQDADARASQKREAELRLMQGRASSAALNREMTIQRETDANPILRDWSAAALPDDVIRLHARPAFASARDYLDWVSARDKLPGAGKQP